MKKQEIENKLVVGAKIKIGEKCAELTGFETGEIITLVEGWFENYNGLYCTDEACPAIRNKTDDDWDSIYHLFGNDLEYFEDSEIIN